MILVQKFRVYDDNKKYITPWRDYRKLCKSMVEVRKELADRVFVRPAQIELIFIEVDTQALQLNIGY